MNIHKIYNAEYFNMLLNMKTSDVDIFNKIAKDLMGYESYREDCWAYAGSILWCRDLYGKYYKISELVSYVCELARKEMLTDKKSSLVLGRTYINLLMIHPYEDGNGRICYIFISYLLYKYFGLFYRILLLNESERLHLSFREKEHAVYCNIIEYCNKKRQEGYICFDRRLKLDGEDIGYYNYKSLMYIINNYGDECLQELADYLESSIINGNGDLIGFRGD